MPCRRKLSCLMLPLLGAVAMAYPPLRAAELSTLFTTPQERQIINSNRYRDDRPKSAETTTPDGKAIDLSIKPLVREEVVQQYVISGITISADGPHSVWINSSVYEDGERLEDNSRIKVLAGDDLRVRITAPDGKQYYAVAGQTLEISYLVTVEN